MEYDNKYIRHLLQLYEEGESSLEQEKELKAYFSSGHYDEAFKEYALLFQFFEAESGTQHPGEVVLPKQKSRFSWMNIAASICIIIGALWFYQYQVEQEKLAEARVAFEKTQNALNLISLNMNKGLEKLEYVEVFSEKKNEILK
ncbi:hypothetical protein [Psychroflexus tropicus]|uniref:hypothetical protein n=1 Tax=Psychroflexus tropicus TaxID=197345 RepID=UPI000370B208|nr:hypothetical protein [Psychroflexus tropicus]